MFAEQLLASHARNLPGPHPGGFAVGIRLNWYRSLPLSCVEQLQLSLDGAPVAPERMALRLNAREYPLTALRAQDDDWWFVLDEAELVVRRPGGIAPGEHDAELVMGTRIPYFGPDPSGGFAVMVDRARVTLVTQ